MDYLQLVPLREDDIDAVESFYGALLAAATAMPDSPLTIDLNQISFIRLESLMALVTGARLWHRLTGKPVTLSRVKDDVHKYLERMNVFTTCGEWVSSEIPLDSQAQWSRSRNPKKLMEIIPVAAEADRNAQDVVDTVVRARQILEETVGSDPRAIGPVTTIVAEIAANITHSDDVGLAAIQHHQTNTRGRTTIAVADLGVGIEGSLRRRQIRGASPTGAAAIREALKLGVTSRGKAGGTGLHLVRSIVDEWQGVLVIRSGTSFVRIEAGTLSYRDECVAVPGTQVTITLHSPSMGSSS